MSFTKTSLIRRGLLSLVLGCITAAALVLYCAVSVRVTYEHWERSGDIVSEHGDWHCVNYRRAGVQWTDLWRGHSGHSVTTLPPLPKPAVDMLARSETNGLLIDSRGWPFLMCYAIVTPSDDPDAPNVYGGKLLSRSDDLSDMTVVDRSFGTVPAMLIWSGAALNVGIFTLAWMLILHCAALVRTHARRPSRTGAIIAIVVCCYLGVITNIVASTCLALGCDEHQHPSDDRYFQTSIANFNYELSVYTEPGATRIVCHPNEQAPSTFSSGTPFEQSDQAFMALPRAWRRFLADPNDPLVLATTNQRVTRIVDARGWPALSFWCGLVVQREQRGPSPVVSTRHALVLSPTLDRDGAWEFVHQALPLGILWPGCLLNSGFYSTLWLMLFLGCGGYRSIIAWFRIRRGKCPECGYDLRGGGGPRCPECGSADDCLKLNAP